MKKLELREIVAHLLKHNDKGPLLLGPALLYQNNFALVAVRSDGAGDVETIMVYLATDRLDEADATRRAIVMGIIEQQTGGVVVHDCASEENLASIGVVAYPTDRMRAFRNKLYN